MKLIVLLKEIQVVPPRKDVLWGWNADSNFTGLVKVRGFKTSQEALDKINKILKLDIEGKYPYKMDSYVDNPSYVYLSDDGRAVFVKDLSSFYEGWKTEEDWGVAEWLIKSPVIY